MNIRVFVLALLSVVLGLYTHALACETCGCQGSAHAGGVEDGGDDHTQGEAGGHEGHEHSKGEKSHAEPMMMDWDYDEHALEHGLKLAVYEWAAPVRVAVVKGMLSDGPEAIFATLMEAVTAQNLANEETQVGSVLPNAMTMESLDDLQYWPGISLGEGMTVAAPLEEYTIQPQLYIMGVHEGPYEGLADTWESVMTYLGEHGVDFDESGVALEHYVSDPSVTPAEDLITEIYIPVVDGTTLTADTH